MVNPYDVIMMPWITEKAMEARSVDNRLEFIVRRSASKNDIAKAVETIFDVEVEKVNVRKSKISQQLLKHYLMLKLLK